MQSIILLQMARMMKLEIESYKNKHRYRLTGLPELWKFLICKYVILNNIKY